MKDASEHNYTRQIGGSVIIALLTLLLLFQGVRVAGRRYPDASFGFYLREAFQSKTNTEEILYNKSR